MGKRRRKGWMCTMNFCLRQLGTLEFWETLLDSFGNLGPIAPIMLAMVESWVVARGRPVPVGGDL